MEFTRRLLTDFRLCLSDTHICRAHLGPAGTARRRRSRRRSSPPSMGAAPLRSGGSRRNIGRHRSASTLSRRRRTRGRRMSIRVGSSALQPRRQRRLEKTLPDCRERDQARGSRQHDHSCAARRRNRAAPIGRDDTPFPQVECPPNGDRHCRRDRQRPVVRHECGESACAETKSRERQRQDAAGGRGKQRCALDSR